MDTCLIWDREGMTFGKRPAWDWFGNCGEDEAGPSFSVSLQC